MVLFGDSKVLQLGVMLAIVINYLSLTHLLAKTLKLSFDDLRQMHLPLTWLALTCALGSSVTAVLVRSLELPSLATLILGGVSVGFISCISLLCCPAKYRFSLFPFISTMA